jgi:hypothetical protein
MGNDILELQSIWRGDARVARTATGGQADCGAHAVELLLWRHAMKGGQVAALRKELAFRSEFRS